MVHTFKVDEIKVIFGLNNNVKLFSRPNSFEFFNCLIFLNVEIFSNVLFHIFIHFFCSFVWFLSGLFFHYGNKRTLFPLFSNTQMEEASTCEC
jgi:hypothetical protein